MNKKSPIYRELFCGKIKEVVAMPMRPKRPCAFPECVERVNEGERFCQEHKKLKTKWQERRRTKDTGRHLYNYKWSQYRRRFLRLYPLCRQCEEQGLVTRATVVDHIKPHKGDYHLFWDSKNHQSLCKRCHDRKTVTEDGGFGRPIG